MMLYSVPGLGLFLHLQLPAEPLAFQMHLSPLQIWKSQSLVGKFQAGLRTCSVNISSFLMLDSHTISASLITA